MTPVVAECTGLWRRTLLVQADGTTDITANVQWLQGLSAFVDLRGPGEGFAGRLSQRGDVFEWTRLIDLQPPSPPDAGRMSWQGDTLVEVGVHADYTEHWLREFGPEQPCWALLLSGAGSARAVLVQVGERFGWAKRDGDVAEISLGAIDGNHWRIIDSADDARVGAVLRPRLASGQLRVDDDIAWTIEAQEGSVAL